MASVRNLLGIGYFPKELPRPFRTVTLAALLTDSSINKPTAFINGKRSAKMCCHNLARPGSLRRKLGIPNPVLHYNLCFDIESHWSDISTHIRKSTLSSSKPSVQDGSQRALASSVPKSHLPLERASIRSTSRFILKTDISRFYPSIYSHSVPWALHTKPVAKQHRNVSSTYYGNSIDRWVRNAQDGQTLGVPIGPDTSWVIAEIILAEVDAALMSIAVLNGIGGRSRSVHTSL